MDLIVFVVAGLLFALAVAVTTVLFIWSWPGRPRPFRDERGRLLPGSISEKVRVQVNGVEQGMFVRGKDATNRCCCTCTAACPSTS